jgi:hypothetical protein
LNRNTLITKTLHAKELHIQEHLINIGIILSGRLKIQTWNIKNIIWTPKEIVLPPD